VIDNSSGSKYALIKLEGRHYLSSAVDWLSLYPYGSIYYGRGFSPLIFSVAPHVLSGISFGSAGEGPGSFFGESSFFLPWCVASILVKGWVPLWSMVTGSGGAVLTGNRRCGCFDFSYILMPQCSSWLA
jgi:hypothetical protein